MKFLSFLIFLLSFFAKGNPQEGVDKIFSLYQNTREVIESQISPEHGSQYNIAPEEVDYLIALSKTDQHSSQYLRSIRAFPECPNCYSKDQHSLVDLYQKIKTKNRLIFSSTQSTDKYNYQQLTANYPNGILKYLTSEAPTPAGLLYVLDGTLSGIIAEYNLQNPNQNILTQTPTDSYKNLLALARTLIPNLPEHYFATTYLQSMLVQNAAQWSDYIKVAATAMNGEDKASVLRYIGGALDKLYNNSRAANDATIYNTATLLKAISTNTSIGVCRDAARAQAEIAEAMGLKNSMVISYLGEKGHHATMITEDIESKKVYRFNWGNSYRGDSNLGTLNLNQYSNLSAVGLDYNVYRPDGKLVEQVPTELHHILHETRGESLSMFDHRAYQLNQATFETILDDGAIIHGSLWKGKTTGGQGVTGITFSFKGKKEITPFMAIGKTQGDGQNYTNETHSFINAGISGESEIQAIKSKDYSIKLYGHANLEILYTDNHANLLSDKLDANAQISLGERTGIKLGPSLYLHNDSSIKSALNRNFANSEYKDISLTTIGIESTTELVTLTKGSGQFILGATELIRDYGTSLALFLKSKENREKDTVTVYVRAPISQNYPSFLPGGTRATGVEFENEIYRGIKFKLNLEQEEKRVQGGVQLGRDY